MDFAVLPPEINSGLLYAGPGSRSMLGAAAAWDDLAAELYAAASSYQSVLSGLTAGTWLGRSSASMAAAAATTQEWMNTTAAQAEQTAAQAKLAAAAYEAAFTETVPPPVIAANRSLFAALVATNFLGQNTAAIAATEADYAEMWAQDAAAMYGYASSSASATTLSPFTEPPQTTTSTGLADQAAAMGQTAGTSAGTAQSNLASIPQIFSAVPTALSSVSPAGITSLLPSDLLDLMADLIAITLDVPTNVSDLGIDTPLTLTAFYPDIASLSVGQHTDDIVSGWAGVEGWAGTGPVPPTPLPAITNPGASPVSAALGEANAVGALSVPAGWTEAAPTIRPAALALPTTNVGAAADGVSTAITGSTLGDMTVGSLAGRAIGSTLGTGYRERAKATPAGSEASREGGSVVEGIVTVLPKLAELRDSGLLTEEEFVELKRRLLGR
jgi:PPE-repeat protein